MTTDASKTTNSRAWVLSKSVEECAAEIDRLRALIMSAVAEIEAGYPNGAADFLLEGLK